MKCMYKHKSILAKEIFFFFLLIALLVVVSCNKESIKENARKELNSNTLIDAVGRTVAIPQNVDGGIITIGSCGPLRFLSIFDEYDHVIEVDRGDVTDSKNGRAYSYAYDYDALAKNYHSNNKLEGETVEKIGLKNPSLIIVQNEVYFNYKENCDILGSQFSLVVLPPQSMSDFFDKEMHVSKWYEEAVMILGKALKKEKRAREHLKDVNAIIADIQSLKTTSDKSVYVAGLTWCGSNELTTTFPSYLPLMLSGGINAHGGIETKRVIMDPEVVTGLNMDYVLIDPSSADKLKTPNSQLIMEWLYKRNSDSNSENDVKIFVTLPMVWDSVNYDCVLAGAYYIDYLLYGTLSFEATEKKITDVYTAYYGENGKRVLPGIKEFFDGKSKLHETELFPLSEVRIEKRAHYFVTVKK